jgi:hypothetical protein
MSAVRTPPAADRRPRPVQTIAQGTLDRWVLMGAAVAVWDQAGHAWHPHVMPGPRGGILWSLTDKSPALLDLQPLDTLVMRYGPAALYLGGAWVFVRWADGSIDSRMVAELDKGER